MAISQKTSTRPEAPLIFAVIVLYERTADESEAFVSLKMLFADNPVLAAEFDVLLYDNSPIAPVRAEIPGGGRTRYVHDASNGGLAGAYRHALELAHQQGCAWLLLLDQDTTLTADYLSKLVSAARTNSAENHVAAIVPILELGGRIYSPEADFFYHLRHQFPYARNFPLARETAGVQTERVNAYNSGAAVRVSAMLAIGGFPSDFRVDYLDHAVFHQLQRNGFLILVLPAVLQQKLSHIDLNTVSLARHQSVLASQRLFVDRYGRTLDRVLYRLWLLRKSRHYRKLCSDPLVWKGMVRTAVGRWPRATGDGA